MSAPGRNKAVVAALAANLGIAASKFVAFAFTGSASMLAEGIHSVADSGNQLLLLYGGRQAQQAPDEEHQFGHAGARYFYAFVVAVVLFTLGSLFALLEGYDKLRNPHEVEKPVIAVGVLLVAIVLEGLSFRTAVREANPHRGDRSWSHFIRHSRSPELPVILLEDSGALIGLALALTGVVLAFVTGEPRYDALGTMSIGLLLGAIAIVLAVEMKSLLLGESATTDQEVAITAALVDGAEIEQLIDLKTMHLGPDDLLVAAKLQMTASLTFAGVARAINEAEARVRAAVPIARMIYLEPDVFSTEYESPGSTAL
ncbi:MAG: cation diffusion facilitator family transporter [Actinomycetota bacterium]